jgi:hypothetical protein
MNHSIGLALLTTGALAVAIVTSSATRGVAQDGSAAGAIRLAEAGGKKDRGASKTVAPRTIAPKQVVMPKSTPQRVVGPKGVSPKQAVSPRVVSPGGVAPRTVGPSGPGLRAIGPRSTGAVYIGGRNYSVWRGSHRVRYGAGWATLAAIGALGVIVYGGARYYPYAYVSATGPYCEGLTEDGCVLQWQEVPTLEGPSLLQCVAYCPWQ